MAYNGHKKNRAPEYQAVTTPDGPPLYASGPIEDKYCDKTLYIRGGLKDSLPDITIVNGVRYVFMMTMGTEIELSWTHRTEVLTLQNIDSI